MTHALPWTLKSVPQAQVVSAPLATSPAALVEFAGQATQVLLATRKFAAHSPQAVSGPEASSPAALIVPAGQATHAFETTCWLVRQRIAVQLVSAPLASSPAGRVVPAAHDTHALLTTC